MINRKNSLIGVVAVIFVVGVLFLIFNKSNKLAYIDFTKVYNEFSYKKELEKEFDVIVSKRQQIIDSLKYQITVKSGSRDTTGLNRLQIEYDYNIQVFENNNTILQNQYYDKIIKQLNQYVYEYGEDNNYDFIFGANGDGSLMYSSKSIDISDKVIISINEKYEGK